MCGEKPLAAVLLVNTIGSPPRVRGKAAHEYEVYCQKGITPACAGKRERGGRRRSCCRDHPRVCGEKIFVIAHSMHLQGSPPRVRGKAQRHLRFLLSSGITPACAGKRLGRQRQQSANQDHPRVCGEKKSGTSILGTRTGSPPRVRGKAIPVVALQILLGITPACAGKRTLSEKQVSTRKDHPRVCGEKKGEVSRPFTGEGSPPRVRGKGILSSVATVRTGITPACAGKSLLRMSG